MNMYCMHESLQLAKWITMMSVLASWGMAIVHEIIAIASCSKTWKNFIIEYACMGS